MNKVAKNQLTHGVDQELLLDEIYNSNNPEIKNQLKAFLFEEMAQAQQRALLRVAKNFSYFACISAANFSTSNFYLLPASQQ